MDAPAAGDARRYYERFSHDVGLRDWLVPNARHEQLTLLIGDVLPRGRDLRILDVGCGAGVMTARLRRYGRVTGVDFSGPAIELARALVPDGRFAVGDVTALDLDERFDVITLFDVLEHIAIPERTAVLRSLRERLQDPGLLIASTPHPGHIRFLRRQRPELLQIVDETVEVRDLLADAEALGLELAHYARFDIEFGGQYQFVALATPPDRTGAPAMDRALRRRILLTTNRLVRPLRRVAAALGARRRGSPDGARILLRSRPPRVEVTGGEHDSRRSRGAPEGSDTTA